MHSAHQLTHQYCSALIVVPTRELAIQISKVVEQLLRPFRWIVSGTLMGGEKKKSEKARLRKGVSILIATPGRLLDHLQTTQCFRVSNLQFFVMDEADRLLDLGFENDLNTILDLIQSRCRQRRQCALLSATLPSKLSALSSRLLRNPERIDVSDAQVHTHAQGEYSLPSTLSQGYIRVPQRHRLTALATFLRWKISTCERGDLKVIVFVNTCDEVDFLSRLFARAFWPPRKSHYRTIDEDEDEDAARDDGDDEEHDALVDIARFRLHGNMSQTDRSAVYNKFVCAKGGTSKHHRQHLHLHPCIHLRPISFPAPSPSPFYRSSHQHGCGGTRSGSPRCRLDHSIRRAP